MSSNDQQKAESSEDKIIDSIYEHIVRSVCIDVACNMHELIKTGALPPSELIATSSRHEIYPELYHSKSPSEVTAILESFGTYQTPTVSRKRKLPSGETSEDDPDGQDGPSKSTDEDSEGDEDFVDPSNTIEDKPSTKQAISNLDIWGKFPPKEPKKTVKCAVCSRFVSTSRFASHLDKCMGLSTARGSSGNPPRASAYTAMK
ncbi:unnamed protein product [Cylindrotheca closterium]|uniref:SAGA-associated factor 11 n=1 Tax=Cylindrotheca closterium TaxID=2856 RepID=A0AAD2FUE2_9STRA|nr:unnamed protein product [Cylindrotheca closterium]